MTSAPQRSPPCWIRRSITRVELVAELLDEPEGRGDFEPSPRPAHAARKTDVTAEKTGTIKVI
jgi:hypothetical protein